MGVRREKRLREGAEGGWDSSGEKSRKSRYCFLYCDYTDFVLHYCLPSLTRFPPLSSSTSTSFTLFFLVSFCLATEKRT